METGVEPCRLVYNHFAIKRYYNFIWPKVDEKQKKKIEATTQAILDAREAKFKKDAGTTLADLYDENTMPPDLHKAHQADDAAVMKAYSFSSKMGENEIIAD